MNVMRGNGSKVHQAMMMGDKVVGTYCAADIRFGSTQHLVLRETSAPVDCKSCLGPQADAPVAPVVTEVPAVCAMHPQADHQEVKTVKAGTKTTYPCGAIFWHGKGWDPKRNHAG